MRESLGKLSIDGKGVDRMYKEAQRKKPPERLPRFTTVSDLEIKDLYTPDDIKDIDPSRQIGLPGSYPFTRGIYPTMYQRTFGVMRSEGGVDNRSAFGVTRQNLDTFVTPFVFFFLILLRTPNALRRTHHSNDKEESA